MSSFNSRVLAFSQRVQMRRAETAADRDAIFALRYRGYLREGAIAPHISERFSDPWDEAPTSMIFGLHVDGELASTMRLHFIGPNGGAIPALEIFSDALAPYMAAGKSIMDPTRFVIDDRFAALGPEVPFVMLRLVTMAAQHYDVDVLLATVRTEHVVMYKRLFGHRPITEPRAYPLLAKPIVCMATEMEDMRALIRSHHLFLESTPRERAAVFGESRNFMAPSAIV